MHAGKMAPVSLAGTRVVDPDFVGYMRSQNSKEEEEEEEDFMKIPGNRVRGRSPVNGIPG